MIEPGPHGQEEARSSRPPAERRSSAGLADEGLQRLRMTGGRTLGSLRLAIVGHKEVWRRNDGHATTGGFPQQVYTLSQLFGQTVIVTMLRRQAPPDGLLPLVGHRLSVRPLPEPRGAGLGRKLLLPLWLARHFPSFWRRLSEADAVHALVPGDVGFIAMVLAQLRRKPLFVRHCGTWGHRATLADRLLAWLLPRIAGGTTVVMATGGGESPPSSENPNVSWIFSTTLTEAELESLPASREPWRPGADLRIVTVARLAEGKNTRAVVEALPAIRRVEPTATLDVVGDGPMYGELVDLVRELELEGVVHFHGNLSHHQVLEVLSRSHLFVFPTRVAEGFPKAVVEAMACALPVVAPPVSVLASLLDEGRGVLLEDTDSATVGRTCADLVRDPERMAAVARAGRLAADRFTLEAWKRTIGERLQTAWDLQETSDF